MKNSPKTLYIIGNGFDIHHRLPTKFSDFADYLCKNQNELYRLIFNYLDLPIKSNCKEKSSEEYLTMWSHFEDKIANLNRDFILNESSNYRASPYDPDFRDRDWGAWAIDIEQKIDYFVTSLCKNLRNYLTSITYSDIPYETLLKLESNALYISFNYTTTLQDVYHKKHTSILYIHNSLIDSENLIIGHGKHPSLFNLDEPRAPYGITLQELEIWRNKLIDYEDYSETLAIQELLIYFERTYKNTQSIISRHEKFFQRMNLVEKVIVLGHSFSDVDIPYFHKIHSIVTENSIWTVSYYYEEEKNQIIQKLLNLGINEKKIFTISLSHLQLIRTNLFKNGNL